MRNLSHEWTKHLDDTKKEDFSKTIRNSTIVLTRLYEILSEYERDVDQANISDDFESPNWGLRQANRLGRKQAYYKIKQLINFIGLQ